MNECDTSKYFFYVINWTFTNPVVSESTVFKTKKSHFRYILIHLKKILHDKTWASGTFHLCLKYVKTYMWVRVALLSLFCIRARITELPTESFKSSREPLQNRCTCEWHVYRVITAGINDAGQHTYTLSYLHDTLYIKLLDKWNIYEGISGETYPITL